MSINDTDRNTELSDDDLDDNQVLVATNASKAPEVYHPRVCRHVPATENVRITTREHAERRGLPECQHCTGNPQNSGPYGEQLSAKLLRIGKQRDGEL